MTLLNVESLAMTISQLLEGVTKDMQGKLPIHFFKWFSPQEANLHSSIEMEFYTPIALSSKTLVAVNTYHTIVCLPRRILGVSFSFIFWVDTSTLYNISFKVAALTQICTLLSLLPWCHWAIWLLWTTLCFRVWSNESPSPPDLKGSLKIWAIITSL